MSRYLFAAGRRESGWNFVKTQSQWSEGSGKQSGKCANDLNASKHSNHREEVVGTSLQGNEGVKTAQKYIRTSETKLLHKTKTDTTRHSQSVSQSVSEES